MRAGNPTVVRPTPPGTRPASSLHRPAFWVVLGLLGIGAGYTVADFRQPLASYPLATTVALILFALYAVPFLWFVGSLDYLEREPPLLLLTAGGWGAMVAATAAARGNRAAADLLAKLVSPHFTTVWGPAIIGPTVEELLKTLGVVAIALIARKQINSVLDGVVYGAVTGLGFQVVENIQYAVSAVELAGRGDRIGPVVLTFLLRGFLGGLWSHTLFSALAGAGVGYFVVRTDRGRPARLAVAGLAFLGAWAFHFGWNSPLLADGFGPGIAGVLTVLLIKGLPPLAMILWLVRSARQREAAYYVTALRSLGDPMIATSGELTALATGHKRAAARHYAYARCGLPGSRVVRRLQRAQARLAVAVSRDDPTGQGDEARRWLAVIRAQRQSLIHMAHPEAAAPKDRRTPAGRWALGLGLVGIVVPLVALVAAGLGAHGLIRSRRIRQPADNWLTAGLLLGGLSVLLWTVTYAIRATGGA